MYMTVNGMENAGQTSCINTRRSGSRFTRGWITWAPFTFLMVQNINVVLGELSFSTQNFCETVDTFVPEKYSTWGMLYLRSSLLPCSKKFLSSNSVSPVCTSPCPVVTFFLDLPQQYLLVLGFWLLQYGVNIHQQEYFADSPIAGTAPSQKTGDWVYLPSMQCQGVLAEKQSMLLVLLYKRSDMIFTTSFTKLVHALILYSVLQLWLWSVPWYSPVRVLCYGRLGSFGIGSWLQGE
jgi:hypothetical protein